MRNFYQARLKYFFFIHVVSLIITGITTTYFSFNEKNHIVDSEGFMDKYKEFESNSKIIRSYYRYTGTETGFGFFAPNVKSHGAMFFESCGTLLDLPFETSEGNLRSTCMISSVTDYIEDELNEKYKSPSLKHRFSDLLIQNLVVKVREMNNLDNKCEIVKVNYKLIEFPPLKSEANSKEPILLNLKTWIYETKN